MTSAINEGFERSTQGKTQAIETEIQQLITEFQSGVEKKDRFDFTYLTGVGTLVSKNGEQKTTIKGLPFREAFFGIWLSDNPIQKSLKADLLSQK